MRLTPFVAFGLAAALTGCGVLSGSDPEAGPSSSAGSAEQGSGAQDDAGDESSSSAGVEDFDPEDVIVEQTVPLAGNPQDSVTIGVQSLVVDGPTMTLRLVVTPDFASVPDGEEINLFEIGEDSTFAPTLLDRENLTEYSVITTDGRRWQSDLLETFGTNGAPFSVFATFPAPQDDVDTLELRVRDVWPAFTDVPVS